MRLPGWHYPVVADVATGTRSFDNEARAWGSQEQTDKLLQGYAIEKTKGFSGASCRDSSRFVERALPEFREIYDNAFSAEGAKVGPPQGLHLRQRRCFYRLQQVGDAG